MNTVLERKEEAMQFIINGRTFNTATATKLAISRGIKTPDFNNVAYDAEVRYEDVLYRTAKGGLLFIHEHNTTKYVKGGKPVTTDEAREVNPEEAVKWIEEWGAMVLDNTGLPMPREAGDDAPASVITSVGKELLEQKIFGSAEFRAQKADQYPDDRRNKQSADALQKLGDNLAAMPDTAPAVQSYLAAWAAASDDEGFRLSEVESMFVSRYGFDFPENGDAITFLLGLTMHLNAERKRG